MSKKQNRLTKFFAKNKPVQLTDHKDGLFYATSTEVSSQKSDEVSDSKGGKRKFQNIWKSVFVNLIEIRILKKFSVSFYILRVFVVHL